MTQQTHVIFGTGPVGMSILDALRVRGDVNIRMVNRSGRTSEPLPAGVELTHGDASDLSFAMQAAAGADVVYGALNPPYSKWTELFPALQASMVAAAESASACLVMIDNLYMYGDPAGRPMSETHPINPNTKKGTLRAQMARDLMVAHEAGRVEVVVGRASDFVGPRVMQSTLGGDTVMMAAMQGKAAQMVGDLDKRHSYTYMPDIGQALVDLAYADDVTGQVWHLPTPHALSTREMLTRIYAEAGHPLKTQIAPRWLLRIIGLFNPDVGEVAEMVYEFETDFIIDDSKFRKRFSWDATDNDTVVRETVSWFRTRANN